ncbi:hypothetical protein TNCV_679541 [Trichonephila clavipes]|nr:hypothetical protein TNCV_679541 [Trichonephila clavipes]
MNEPESEVAFDLTFKFHGKIVEVRRLVESPSTVPSGTFTELIRTVHLYSAQGLGQRQAYFYPLATMYFVGLDLPTSDRWY